MSRKQAPVNYKPGQKIKAKTSNKRMLAITKREQNFYWFYRIIKLLIVSIIAGVPVKILLTFFRF